MLALMLAFSFFCAEGASIKERAHSHFSLTAAAAPPDAAAAPRAAAGARTRCARTFRPVI